MNVINISNVKGAEIFWYEDLPNWKVVIGVRGVGELKIDKWAIVRAEDSFRNQYGRAWTEQEGLQWAIGYAKKESEYTEFEEVKPEIKLLS